MANFGELVLILGDLHIPGRASKIPAPFKRMLVPNKMQHVICTGNISLEDYDELRTLAPNLHVVAGDYDDEKSGFAFPETRVLQVGSFRIGVIHGHQILPWKSPEALSRMRRKLHVDILVSGHTHKHEVTLQEGSYYHINPVTVGYASAYRVITTAVLPHLIRRKKGSITGAYSPLTDNIIPSFVLLAVQDTKVVCYVYELSKNGEVDVTKTEFTKQQTQAASNPALLESLLM